MTVSEEWLPNVTPVDENENGLQDGAGEQSVGTPIRNTYTYCVCNSVETQTVDADGLALTSTTILDLNGKPIYRRSPGGAVTTSLYDERDLLIEKTRGANDTSVASTMRWLYDGNGNQVEAQDDDLDVDPSDTPTVYTFDLFDRLTMVTDELGNESERVYDRGSFVRQEIRRGPDGWGGGTEILAQTFHEYDEAGREFQTDRDHFDPVGDTALAHGDLTPPMNNSASARENLVSSVVVYNAAGMATVQIDDNLHAVTTDFDAAYRTTKVTDAKGNWREMGYDRDGHAIDVKEHEIADVGSNQDHVSRTFVDELGRAMTTVSPLGNTQRRLFNARGDAVQVADAQAESEDYASDFDAYTEHTFGTGWSGVAVSGRGNRVVQTFDNAGRNTKTERFLTSDGTGGGDVEKTVTTERTYTKDSRPLTQTDDNGNATHFYYNALGQQTGILNADGTEKLFFFDKAMNLRGVRDERAVLTSLTVDKLGRRTETEVTNLPFGPGQTSFELFSYSGLGQMVRGENNHSVLWLRYSSLGQVIEEDQTINVGADRTSKTEELTSYVEKSVTAEFDGAGNRLSLHYPGGTTLNATFDAIDRPAEFADGETTIAEYRYVGFGSRVLEKELTIPGITLYRTFDGERRVIRHDQRLTASPYTRLAGFTQAWSRAGGRWWERTLVNNDNPSETGGIAEVFGPDSLGRLRNCYQGVESGSLNENNTSAFVAPGSGTHGDHLAYQLDGVGNREKIQKNGLVDTVYLLNGDDAKTNQYTFIDDDFQSHDAAGNLLTDGTWQFFFSFNRLRGEACVDDGCEP